MLNIYDAFYWANQKRMSVPSVYEFDTAWRLENDAQLGPFTTMNDTLRDALSVSGREDTWYRGFSPWAENDWTDANRDHATCAGWDIREKLAQLIGETTGDPNADADDLRAAVPELNELIGWLCGLGDNALQALEENGFKITAYHVDPDTYFLDTDRDRARYAQSIFFAPLSVKVAEFPFTELYK